MIYKLITEKNIQYFCGFLININFWTNQEIRHSDS